LTDGDPKDEEQDNRKDHIHEKEHEKNENGRSESDRENEKEGPADTKPKFAGASLATRLTLLVTLDIDDDFVLRVILHKTPFGHEQH